MFINLKFRTKTPRGTITLNIDKHAQVSAGRDKDEIFAFIDRSVKCNGFVCGMTYPLMFQELGI